MSRLGKNGFTLVELTIAMAIFSAAISIITITFVGLLRSQRAASATREVTENAKAVTEEMTSLIQGGSSVQGCTGVPGSSGDSLLVTGESSALYYVNDSGQLMKDGDVSGECPTDPVAGSPITSSRVTTSGFNVTQIGDGVAAQISFTMKEATQQINIQTAVAVRE